MRKRLTITMRESILHRVDNYVDGLQIRNRSHAIEFLLNKALYASQTQVVVLAGGKGTRMRPYTIETPKSMLPLKNKPLLEHLIKLLSQSGIRDIILCIGEHGDKIKRYFGNGERFGVSITYSEETAPRGTGGALLQAKNMIKSSPFLVVYGDLFTDIDFRDLLSFALQHGDAATMVLKSLQNVKSFGQITIRGTQVTGFYSSKKGLYTQKRSSNLVNAGIYVFTQGVFELMPRTKKPFQVEDIIKKYIEKSRMSGYVHDGIWFDVGTAQDYEKAIKAAGS